ncbi:MAG: hypothetical protein Q8Q74_17015, partial [Polaromonas sp.]|nr:hypothetical protein [Polaromonas sp.]
MMTAAEPTTVALAVPAAVTAWLPPVVRTKPPIMSAQAMAGWGIFGRQSFFFMMLLAGKTGHRAGRHFSQQKIHAVDEFSVGQDVDLTHTR